MTLKTSAGEWRVSFEYEVGGYTFCRFEDDNKVAVGMAMCHPKDRFEKRIGRRVAFADALALLEQDREQRRELWTALWEKGVGR